MIRIGMFWGVLGAFAMALSLAAARPALADNPNCTSNTFTFPLATRNLCNGEEIVGTATITETFCYFVDGSGGVHSSVTVDATGAGVGSNTGITYTFNEHLVSPFPISNVNAQGNGELHHILHENIISQGPAPNFVVTCEIDATIQNFMVVAVRQNNCTEECSGQGSISGP